MAKITLSKNPHKIPTQVDGKKVNHHATLFFFFFKIVPHSVKVGCDLQAGNEPQKRRGRSSPGRDREKPSHDN